MDGTRRSDGDGSVEFPGFAKLPRKLPELLKRQDLTFHEFALLAFLLGAANFRTHVWTGTLRSLQDQICWPHGGDHLRKTLLGLREAGWLTYTSRAGQREAYTVGLTRKLRETGVRIRHASSEVTPDTESSRRRANEDVDPISRSWQPQLSDDPQEREQERELNQDGRFF